MNLLKRIWDNFKTQPDSWFFYGFLATFTLSIRKVLFFYPINSQFNEYTGIYLYLSDIFLILAILTWVIIVLCNKYSILSILKSTNVPRGTILIPAILVIWSFISILWSTNPNVALFRSFKLLEFYLLFLYIIFRIVPRASRQMFHVEQSSNIISPNCSTWNNTAEIIYSDWDGTIFKNSFRIIIATGVIQSILGIWQVIIQHSIGLTWLKESLISPDILGVAKVIFDNDKIVRAYGLFPHPNILGGFLTLSIILTITYYRMFHVEQSNNSISDIKCSTWNNDHCEVYTPTKNTSRPTHMFHVEQLQLIWSRLLQWQNTNKRLLYNLILAIQILATFLTFSKSAILGLLIAVFYIFTQQIVPRGTIMIQKISKMFHVEHFSRKLLLILGIFIALMVITEPNIDSLLFKSLRERMVYINVSRGTILSSPIFGIGSGQFVTNMSIHTNQTLSEWQFQPVHNIFLLIWSELGLIGLSLFILLLRIMFHVEHSQSSPDTNSDIKCSTWNNNHCEVYTKKQNVPRGTLLSTSNINRVFKGILLGFIFIMFFDHYLWDIQQGQILLWIIFGLLASLNRRYIDK